MKSRKSESGFALLIMLMGALTLGGLMTAGYLQSIAKKVEAKRVADNTDILKRAKQALLMYAYNYPAISLAAGGTARGPGRLPCPDTNNNGSPNATFNCINGTALVGRLPENANGVNFHDAVDSSGESLWYAVSQNFANTGPAVINSDTLGTITIFDQTGSIAYDGAASGIAAVIIAPGPPINGQDRIVGPNLASNYLDSFNAFDNSGFANLSNTTGDGFILGPVFDAVQNSYVINDQMILITAEEVIEIAEKAVLDAYKNAINDYLSNTGSVYPWLYNYDVNNLDYYSGSANISVVPDYPNGSLSNTGRIPSIFNNYFSDNDSQAIDSEITVDVTKQFTVSGNAYSLQLNVTSSVANNVAFSDGGDTTDNSGSLTLNGTGDNLVVYKYFWDDHDSPTGVWTECLDDGDGNHEESDCYRDTAGNPDPGRASNQEKSRIIRVGIRLDMTVNVQIDFNDSTAPLITYVPASENPPNVANHAEIHSTFLSNNITTFPVTFFYERDDHFHEGDSFEIGSQGSQEIKNNSDMGVILNQSIGDITLGLRYYPPLPAWALANDWHNSIQMSYALAYSPGSSASCSVLGNNCLLVDNQGGENNDNKALLIIAGQHGLIDDEDLDGSGPLVGDGYIDDLVGFFDAENDNLDRRFDLRAVGGNDTILILDKL